MINNQIKPKKSAGLDGVSPGLFKLLPVQWILTLTLLLNNVFVLGYPAKWVYSRLNMLYKKGDSLDSIVNYMLFSRNTYIKPWSSFIVSDKRLSIERYTVVMLSLNFCVSKIKEPITCNYDI